MNTLLQEFYRGKMQPGETVITEEQKKDMSIVIAYQNALLSMLDKKEADLCKKMWEAMNEQSARDCEREYIRGMRMGARLALALLGEKAQ
ncbi:MAG: hypothetical protein E7321_01045 [Clostridiales bacterium]|nr:hypothetical protein [Clostridiales bacterium]